ncbi:MAG: helix-turn-helix domain-containing protein [Pirellulales bacterium]
MSPTIKTLFDEYKGLTGSAEAAATLVLAQVQSSRTDEPPPFSPVDYLTVKQAAKRYNIGERTVYRMIEDGLPVTRVGKAIRIRPRDLAKRLADLETILR